MLQAVVAEPYLLRMRILVLLLLLSVVAVTLSLVVEESEEGAEGPETQGRVELIKPFNLQTFESEGIPLNYIILLKATLVSRKVQNKNVSGE